MNHLRTILFATDLSSTGPEAVSVAGQIAQLFDAHVDVFHVVKRHSDLHLADFRIIERASQKLQTVKNQLTAMGAKATALPIEFGSPSDAIVREADRCNAELIVMGCGRHLPDRESAAGAIAESVIQRARQPVLAVFPGSMDGSLRKILCPVDHSRSSRRSLKNAIRLTQAFGSEIVTLTVVPEVSWLEAALESGDVTNVKAEFDRKWRNEFSEFVDSIPFGNVAWHEEVRTGSPHEEIVAAALEHNVGLIVMGAIGRTGIIRSSVGSVTRKVLRKLPCSILVVKDEDLIDEFTIEDARVVELLYAEATALLEAESFEAAIAKFDQLLTHHPFHEAALLGRADALDRIGETERAEGSRRRAAAIGRVASATASPTAEEFT